LQRKGWNNGRLPRHSFEHIGKLSLFIEDAVQLSVLFSVFSLMPVLATVRSKTLEKNKKAKTFSVTLKVPFHHLDPLQVVWHGNYCKYFEAARDGLFYSAGLDFLTFFSESGLLFPIIRMSAKYIRPLRYKDEFVCTARIVEAKRKIVIEREPTRWSPPIIFCCVDTPFHSFTAAANCLGTAVANAAVYAINCLMESVKSFTVPVNATIGDIKSLAMVIGNLLFSIP
jgi:acyl-CoA thioester hydrolase